MIFQFGYNYQKVGIILSKLVSADYRQKGVFVEGPDERLIKLGKVMDKLAHQHGWNRVRLASQGFDFGASTRASITLLHDEMGRYNGSEVIRLK